MGMYNNLFVGPYAQWEVPAKHQAHTPGDTLDWVLVEQGVFHQQSYGGELPGRIRRKREFFYHTLMPAEKRPEGPEREMYFSGQGYLGVGTLDLTEVNRQAEIDWFAQAFEGE